MSLRLTAAQKANKRWPVSREGGAFPFRIICCPCQVMAEAQLRDSCDVTRGHLWWPQQGCNHSVQPAAGLWTSTWSVALCKCECCGGCPRAVGLRRVQGPLAPLKARSQFLCLSLPPPADTLQVRADNDYWEYMVSSFTHQVRTAARQRA